MASFLSHLKKLQWDLEELKKNNFGIFGLEDYRRNYKKNWNLTNSTDLRIIEKKCTYRMKVHQKQSILEVWSKMIAQICFSTFNICQEN